MACDGEPDHRVSLGYLDASYDEFEFEGVDLIALDIPFASEVQVGCQATYVQPLPVARRLLITWLHTYQDEAEMSPFDPNAVGVNCETSDLLRRWNRRTLVDLNITYLTLMQEYSCYLVWQELAG